MNILEVEIEERAGQRLARAAQIEVPLPRDARLPRAIPPSRARRAAGGGRGRHGAERGDAVPGRGVLDRAPGRSLDSRCPDRRPGGEGGGAGGPSGRASGLGLVRVRGAGRPSPGSGDRRLLSLRPAASRGIAGRAWCHQGDRGSKSMCRTPASNAQGQGPLPGRFAYSAFHADLELAPARSLAEIEAMTPEDMARASRIVSAAYNELLQTAASLEDAGYRRLMTECVASPKVTFLELYPSAEDRRKLFDDMVRRGFFNAEDDADHVFPPGHMDPQTYLTAPSSHNEFYNAHPGGLALTVAYNIRMADAYTAPLPPGLRPADQPRPAGRGAVRPRIPEGLALPVAGGRLLARGAAHRLRRHLARPLHLRHRRADVPAVRCAHGHGGGGGASALAARRQHGRARRGDQLDRRGPGRPFPRGGRRAGPGRSGRLRPARAQGRPAGHRPAARPSSG